MSIWLPFAVVGGALVLYGVSHDVRRWLTRSLDDLDRARMVREHQAADREAAISPPAMSVQPPNVSDEVWAGYLAWDAQHDEDDKPWSLGDVADVALAIDKLTYFDEAAWR